MTDDAVKSNSFDSSFGESPLEWLDKNLVQPINLPRIEVEQLYPQSLLDSMLRIGAVARRITEELTAAFAPAMELFKEILVDIERSRRIEATGWLPHYTTPFSLISDGMTVDEIAAVIETHYRENWEVAEAAFLIRLDASGLDDEAKATFREALTCHRHGLYRSVPRTLFPEIERVACAVLYDGSRIYRKDAVNGAKPKEYGITSLPDFAEAVGDLPIGHVLTTDYGYALYRKLQSHLYKPIKRSDEIAIAEVDPVPNRHASLHGIVPYSTMMNSLNALIMTDFVFHLIDEIRSITVKSLD